MYVKKDTPMYCLCYTHTPMCAQHWTLHTFQSPVKKKITVIRLGWDLNPRPLTFLSGCLTTGPLSLYGSKRRSLNIFVYLWDSLCLSTGCHKSSANSQVKRHQRANIVHRQQVHNEIHNRMDDTLETEWMEDSGEQRCTEQGRSTDPWWSLPTGQRGLEICARPCQYQRQWGSRFPS